MWTDSIEVLNPSEGVRAVRRGCLKGGCAHAKPGSPACCHCGFDAREDIRRRRLPLVMGADGLKRKNVGE